MDIDKAESTLRLLSKSDTKVQIYFRIDDQNPYPLNRDAEPILASDAIKMVRICQSVAIQTGRSVDFSIRRWEA